MIRVGDSDAFGTLGGAYATGGASTIGNATISGLGGDIGIINKGDYVSVSAGFPTDKGYFRVVNKSGNSLTLDVVAASSQTGLTVVSRAGFYTDGVADTVARTLLLSKYLNQIQEEIANAIGAAGITLDETDKTQLAKARNLYYHNPVGLGSGFTAVQGNKIKLKVQNSGNITAEKIMTLGIVYPNAVSIRAFAMENTLHDAYFMVGTLFKANVNYSWLRFSRIGSDISANRGWSSNAVLPTTTDMMLYLDSAGDLWWAFSPGSSDLKMTIELEVL